MNLLASSRAPRIDEQGRRKPRQRARDSRALHGVSQCGEHVTSYKEQGSQRNYTSRDHGRLGTWISQVLTEAGPQGGTLRHLAKLTRPKSFAVLPASDFQPPG